jgi:3-hydroxyacyl-[acyl-carrier-protein] dehydratase
LIEPENELFRFAVYLMPPAYQNILLQLPCKPPYQFIDEIISIGENSITGTYTFKQEEFFFGGHFPGNPITPGAILVEAAAQTGLLAFGIYLMELEQKPLPKEFYLVSSEMDFKRIIRPGDRIIIHSEKVFFRFGKLKCRVHIALPGGELVCKGVLSGMIN